MKYLLLITALWVTVGDCQSTESSGTSSYTKARQQSALSVLRRCYKQVLPMCQQPGWAEYRGWQMVVAGRFVCKECSNHPTCFVGGPETTHEECCSAGWTDQDCAQYSTDAMEAPEDPSVLPSEAIVENSAVDAVDVASVDIESPPTFSIPPRGVINPPAILHQQPLPIQQQPLPQFPSESLNLELQREIPITPPINDYDFREEEEEAERLANDLLIDQFLLPEELVETNNEVSDEPGPFLVPELQYASKTSFLLPIHNAGPEPTAKHPESDYPDSLRAAINEFLIGSDTAIPEEPILHQFVLPETQQQQIVQAQQSHDDVLNNSEQPPPLPAAPSEDEAATDIDVQAAINVVTDTEDAVAEPPQIQRSAPVARPSITSFPLLQPSYGQWPSGNRVYHRQRTAYGYAIDPYSAPVHILQSFGNRQSVVSPPSSQENTAQSNIVGESTSPIKVPVAPPGALGSSPDLSKFRDNLAQNLIGNRGNFQAIGSNFDRNADAWIQQTLPNMWLQYINNVQKVISQQPSGPQYYQRLNAVAADNLFSRAATGKKATKL